MASESIQERIEREAKRALIWNAVFRLESALVVAGTILLSVFVTPFPGWPPWAWPLLGVIAEAAVIVSSLTDKGEMKKVMEALFREKYNTNGIRDRALRVKLDEAEQYRRRILQAAEQQPSGVLRDRLMTTISDVYEWIANMVRLARRIDIYRSDSILRRDMDAVPREIKDLSARMTLESDPRVREQMATTLESKRQLLGNLSALSKQMERADLQLDHSLAALGTVYAQVLLVGGKDVDSDRTERLQEDIRGEVAALGDLVESLNEVYSFDSELEGASGQSAAARSQQAGRSGS